MASSKARAWARRPMRPASRNRVEKPVRLGGALAWAVCVGVGPASARRAWLKRAKSAADSGV